MCDGPQTDLEGGPALAVVVALQTLEQLGLVALVGVHVEAQVLLGQEARAADPAVVGSQQRLEGLVIATAGQWGQWLA